MSAWWAYIKRVSDFMSDWAIAFDYNNRCLWLDDETLQFRDLGYDVTFTTLEDNKGMTFLLISILR